EPLNTAAQSARLCLDEEVDVVSLDAEVEDAKRYGRCPGESGSDNGEDIVAPERRNVGARPERDVHRAAPIVRRASTMSDMPPAGRPGRPAPSRWPPHVDGEGSSNWRPPCFILNRAHITSLLACQIGSPTRRYGHRVAPLDMGPALSGGT